jgi:hypothetical protein
MKYLGIPIDKKRIKNSDWNGPIGKIEKRLGSWIGKNMSIAGRTILINSSISSITLYMLSFYRLPVGVDKKFSTLSSKFLWGDDPTKKKYHLVRWSDVCLPKDQGGLGILNLDLMNIALLSKWIWKLFNGSGLWQTILKGKYLKGQTLRQATYRNGDSHFWQGLLEVKTFFLNCCKFQIGDGRSVSFWEDNWLGDFTLAASFPRLFAICLTPNITVRKAFDEGLGNMAFRRALVGAKQGMWADLRKLCEAVTFSEGQDTLCWLLTESGQFTVKSFYLALQNFGAVPHKFLWKVKIPLRIKTFIWLVLKKSILTKDELVHRGGSCDLQCMFCGKNETTDHLFFQCPLARYMWNVVSCALGVSCTFMNVKNCLLVWLKQFKGDKKKIIIVGVSAVLWSLWKARNMACFQKVWPSDPSVVLFRACYWIDFWSNLQVKEDVKLELQRGAKLLEQVASEVFKDRRRWTPWIPRLEG